VEIEENEMGGVCGAYGGEERRLQGFSGETWESDHLVDTDVDGRIILR
jgi:hypothetical protein